MLISAICEKENFFYPLKAKACAWYFYKNKKCPKAEATGVFFEVLAKP